MTPYDFLRRLFRVLMCSAAGLTMAVGPCDQVYDKVCPECDECVIDDIVDDLFDDD